MSTPFDPKGALIRLFDVEVEGPLGMIYPIMALDTGSTSSSVSATLLASVGYVLGASTPKVSVTTGTGRVSVPRHIVLRLKALGQERLQFPVYAHTLPPTATAEGLLGLDFIRDLTLTIDFRTGQITLI